MLENAKFEKVILNFSSNHIMNSSTFTASAVYSFLYGPSGGLSNDKLAVL